MPNFWVTAGAQHLRTLAHSLPKGAESAPHRGGNAREKTSKRFHFYSPTSAAGTRGMVIIPLHISTLKRLHKFPAKTHLDVEHLRRSKYIPHATTPRAPSADVGL